MQNLTVITICDIDWILDEREIIGREVLWRINGEQYLLDACDGHMKKITLAEMDELVLEFGRPARERGQGSGDVEIPLSRGRGRGRRRAATPAVTEERVKCPYPGCGTPSKNRNSLMVHFKTRHGERLAIWEAEHSEEEVPFFYCSCGEKFVSLQTRGSHKRRAKGEHHDADAEPYVTVS